MTKQRLIAPPPVPGAMETLGEISERLAVQADFGPDFPEPMDFELAFTELYQSLENADPVERELKLLRFQFDGMLQDVQEGDLLAGRTRYPLVGFSPEPVGVGFYHRPNGIRALLNPDQQRFTWNSGTRDDREKDRTRTACVFSKQKQKQVKAMLEFWDKNASRVKVRARYPKEIARILPSDNWSGEAGEAFPLYRLAGLQFDYKPLLKGGINGLQKDILERSPNPHGVLAQGFISALDLVCHYAGVYADRTARQADAEVSPLRKTQLARMSADLRLLQSGAAPQTFRQAVQLVWLYSVLAQVWNYGRLDDALGTFLSNDLDEGRISEEEAVQLLCSWWRLMAAFNNRNNNRIIVGGRGRANEPQADRFALLAMEATLRTHDYQPQLSLRFYKGQNPALYARALDVIGAGCTFPILYDDDVNIPAVMKAHRISREEAVHWLPFGCGEYTLESRSVSTPNGLINLPMVLDEVLQKAANGAIDASNFEKLFQAYAERVTELMRACAVTQKIQYDVLGEQAPFLLLSILFEDCIARDKGLCQGGIRYLGGTNETYGNITTADAFTAINRLVYKEKKYTLADIARACRENFENDEKLRQDLLAAPKYGNDDDEADSMAVRVHEQVCNATAAQAAPAGLDTYLVVVVNNWGNTILGRFTCASPDGRKAGEPMSNANNPTSGNDRNGTTAFLNSLTKLDPSIHAGAVQNMKFAKSMFTRDRAKTEALLSAYWNKGGQQAMITVVSREDLEAAMREPEKWGHLLVRVGGFSIRFVELPRDVQLDVLRRTLNE